MHLSSVAAWIGLVAAVLYLADFALSLLGRIPWLRKHWPQLRKPGLFIAARLADAVGVGAAIALIFVEGQRAKVILALCLAGAFVARVMLELRERRKAHQPPAEPAAASVADQPTPRTPAAFLIEDSKDGTVSGNTVYGSPVLEARRTERLKVERNISHASPPIEPHLRVPEITASAAAECLAAIELLETEATVLLERAWNRQLRINESGFPLPGLGKELTGDFSTWNTAVRALAKETMSVKERSRITVPSGLTLGLMGAEAFETMVRDNLTTLRLIKSRCEKVVAG